MLPDIMSLAVLSCKRSLYVTMGTKDIDADWAQVVDCIRVHLSWLNRIFVWHCEAEPEYLINRAASDVLLWSLSMLKHKAVPRLTDVAGIAQLSDAVLADLNERQPSPAVMIWLHSLIEGVSSHTLPQDRTVVNGFLLKNRLPPIAV